MYNCGERRRSTVSCRTLVFRALPNKEGSLYSKPSSKITHDGATNALTLHAWSPSSIGCLLGVPVKSLRHFPFCWAPVVTNPVSWLSAVVFLGSSFPAYHSSGDWNSRNNALFLGLCGGTGIEAYHGAFAGSFNGAPLHR